MCGLWGLGRGLLGLGAKICLRVSQFRQRSEPERLHICITLGKFAHTVCECVCWLHDWQRTRRLQCENTCNGREFTTGDGVSRTLGKDADTTVETHGLAKTSTPQMRKHMHWQRINTVRPAYNPRSKSVGRARTRTVEATRHASHDHKWPIARGNQLQQPASGP